MACCPTPEMWCPVLSPAHHCFSRCLHGLCLGFSGRYMPVGQWPFLSQNMWKPGLLIAECQEVSASLFQILASHQIWGLALWPIYGRISRSMNRNDPTLSWKAVRSGWMVQRTHNVSTLNLWLGALFHMAGFFCFGPVVLKSWMLRCLYKIAVSSLTMLSERSKNWQLCCVQCTDSYLSEAHLLDELLLWTTV